MDEIISLLVFQPLSLTTKRGQLHNIVNMSEQVNMCVCVWANDLGGSSPTKMRWIGFVKLRFDHVECILTNRQLLINFDEKCNKC